MQHGRTSIYVAERSNCERLTTIKDKNFEGQYKCASIEIKKRNLNCKFIPFLGRVEWNVPSYNTS